MGLVYMSLKNRFWLRQAFTLCTLVLIILLLIATSCENHQSTEAALRGRWVESVDRTDTLAFVSIDGERYINVLRGKEMVNGQWIFKESGGLYQYIISGDEISLKLLASSSMTWQKVPFQVTDNSLVIGNFYELSQLGTTLRFERLR